METYLFDLCNNCSLHHYNYSSLDCQKSLKYLNVCFNAYVFILLCISKSKVFVDIYFQKYIQTCLIRG